MALHKIDNVEKTPRCKVCGELAGWYDKAVHNVQTKPDKDSMENIGTGKGLVYATCDNPTCPLKLKGEPIVCQHIDHRPDQHKVITMETRKIRSRYDLPYPYKGMDSCMVEGFYTRHDGKLITFQCCRNEACMQHFYEQGKKIGQAPLG